MRIGMLAIYLVLWPAVSLFEIAISDVDASLKWMPCPSKLKSGTCITEEKPAVRLILQLTKKGGFPWGSSG